MKNFVENSAVNNPEIPNSEKYKKEALDVARRISRQWLKLKDKQPLADPQLAEIWQANRPPKTGIQMWFEDQLDFIEKQSGGDENAKSRMTYRLKENLESIEKRVSEIIGMESEAPKTNDQNRNQSSAEYLSELSVERKQELIDAKNALKEVVESIPHDKLKKMVSGLTADFIEGFDGDVNRFVLRMLEGELIGNGSNPDVGAYHVVEKLNQIREELSSE